MSITPQAQTLLTHLRKGGTLTQRSAHIDFSVGSLTKRISELRDAGWNVEGNWETNHKTGQRFMRYRMGAPERAAQVEQDGIGRLGEAKEPKREFDKYIVVDDVSTLKPGDRLQLLEVNGKDIASYVGELFAGVMLMPVVMSGRDQHGRFLATVVSVEKGEVGGHIVTMKFPMTVQRCLFDVEGETAKVARLENVQ